jgi:hypothetical protein
MWIVIKEAISIDRFMSSWIYGWPLSKEFTGYTAKTNLVANFLGMCAFFFVHICLEVSCSSGIRAEGNGQIGVLTDH